MPDFNQTEPAIMLRSPRITVEIARPGTVYRGSRFDWTAFITQVTLDGAHTFCVPESTTPGQGTGGIGLCNEFGINEPIGYGEIEPGEQFPKLGVGLLTRIDGESYQFARPYPITPFPISMEHGADYAKFTVEPLPCRGYAARLEKLVTVAADRLILAYRLENIGERRIITTEYNHNFLGIDGRPAGPEYLLRFAYAPNAGAWPEAVWADGGKISWRSVPLGEFYFHVNSFPTVPPHGWELINVRSGAGVRGTEDFAPCRLPVWGHGGVICPEVFIAIDLAPGAVMTWRREYEFFG